MKILGINKFGINRLGKIGSSSPYRKPQIPTGLTLTLISGGVRVDFTDNSGGIVPTEVWMKIDSGSYELNCTIAAGTVTKDILMTPEDLISVKLRAGITGSYSDYTAEVTKVMLGDNIVPSASSDFATDGSALWTPYGTRTYNSGTHDLTVSQAGTGVCGIYKNPIVTVGKTYLVRFDAKSSDYTAKMGIDNGGGTYFTDITNLNLTTDYQTFKFIGTQSGTLIKVIRLYPGSVTNKSFVIDNIKIQEAL